MVCRIHRVTWIEKPVIGKEWPSERAYPKHIINTVFEANPETAPFIPELK